MISLRGRSEGSAESIPKSGAWAVQKWALKAWKWTNNDASGADVSGEADVGGPSRTRRPRNIGFLAEVGAGGAGVRPTPSPGRNASEGEMPGDHR